MLRQEADQLLVCRTTDRWRLHPDFHRFPMATGNLGFRRPRLDVKPNDTITS